MIELYDPRGNRDVREARIAARPTSLVGQTIGVLDNGKENADALLERAADLLQARGATIVRARKPSYSRAAPSEVIAALAACTAVLTAHGG